MNDLDIKKVLQSYKSGLDFAIGKIEAQDQMIASLNEKLDSLEHVLYDEILNPAEEALNTYSADQRFGDFNDKYGEKLSSFNAQLAPLEDEGFDLSRATFDNYEQIPEEERPDSDAYVDEVVKLAEEKISEIKTAMGIPEDADVTITQDGDTGETEVAVNGENVSDETTEDVMMGNALEDDEEVVDEEDSVEEKETDEDEIAAFEEELRKSL